MYRRPKFLEVLFKVREEMAREADYDIDFYIEMVRSGIQPATDKRYSIAEAEDNAGNVRKAQKKKPADSRSNRG